MQEKKKKKFWKECSFKSHSNKRTYVVENTDYELEYM